jgi:hypothetical protein
VNRWLLWVKMRNTPCEQMFSGSPLNSDITRCGSALRICANKATSTVVRNERDRHLGGLKAYEKRIVIGGYHRRRSREMLRIFRRSFDVQFGLDQPARLGFFPCCPKLAR